MAAFFKHARQETMKSPEPQASAAPEIEQNVNGEPLYLYSMDGHLVINDPTLLLGRIEEGSFESQ